MAGINVDAKIGAKGFVQGIDDMVGALEDLQDSVTEVQKDGDASLEKLEKSFAEVAKASRTAGDDVKRGFGDSTKEGLKDAEGGLKDFKEESISTAKESAASFDGSAESIVDSFQEIAANAFAGFGPAGAIAGLGIAAGIGIGTAAFTKQQEEVEKSKQRIADLGSAMIASGSDVAGLENIQKNLELIVTNAEDAPKKFDDIKKAAKETGLGVSQLAAAYSGNKEALDTATEAAEKAYKAEVKFNSANDEGGVALEGKGKALQQTVIELQKLQEEQEAAAQVEKDWLAQGGAETLAKAEAISTINDAYDEVVNSVTDYVNSETGVLDVQAYIDAMQQRADALANYQTKLAESNFTTEQKDALNSMGIEAASAWMAGYESATPDQKAAMEKFLTESASETSGVAKGVIDEAFAKPTEAKVEAVADTATAQKTLDALVKSRTAKIELSFVDKRTGKEIDQ